MQAKGILTAVLAAGVLLLAPGFEGPRADQNQVHRQNHQQAYQGNGHAYGWRGQQAFGNQRHGGHAYGKRARNYYDGHLTRHERKHLKRLRHRFDSDRAFRRYLRHNKPRLFAHYAGHQRQHYAYGHRVYRQGYDNRRHRAGRQVWYQGQTRRAH